MSSNTRGTSNKGVGGTEEKVWIEPHITFVQVCECTESSLFGGGNPMLTYLMGLTSDGTLYKLSKSDRKWEKWGGV